MRWLLWLACARGGPGPAELTAAVSAAAAPGWDTHHGGGRQLELGQALRMVGLCLSGSSGLCRPEVKCPLLVLQWRYRTCALVVSNVYSSCLGCWDLFV